MPTYALLLPLRRDFIPDNNADSSQQNSRTTVQRRRQKVARLGVAASTNGVVQATQSVDEIHSCSAPFLRAGTSLRVFDSRTSHRRHARVAGSARQSVGVSA